MGVASVLHRHTLSNGLRIWCQPRPNSESVAALLVLRAGSRYETQIDNGVSHFVEHMVFTGTERWSESEIKSVITRRGGRWNGFTGPERTTYFAQVAVQDLDLALDWLAQIVFHPTFPADKVDKERRVIFQERWGRYGWLVNKLDDLGFGYDLGREVRRAVFPGSTLGLRIEGDDDSLERLDRVALLDYYHKHYGPDNGVLIVVGGVAPEQVFERAEFHLGVLEKKGRPVSPDTPSLPTGGPHNVIVRGPMATDQVRLALGARTVGRHHADRWALDVLSEVTRKELLEEIRYRQGLVYSLNAYNVTFDDAGYFGIHTRSERGNRRAIHKTLEAYLEQVQRGQVEVARVVEAQAALKGRWALAMEDNVTRAGWLARWSSVLRDDELLPDYAAAIDAVTPVGLSQVVGTYFAPQWRYVGVHQPVATVASGVRTVGAAVGLGIGAYITRRLWRRGRTHR
jgi:predicted Zn-dependent peptidase